jgi:hypothetical protein
LVFARGVEEGEHLSAGNIRRGDFPAIRDEHREVPAVVAIFLITLRSSWSVGACSSAAQFHMSWMAGFRQTLRDLLRSVGARETSLQRSTTHWPIGWKDAEDRGLQLLMRNLSPVQREQYENGGYFEVTGGVTGKRYRIRRGYQMNVEELDQKGRRVHLLCFVPEGRVPVADVMLAQKIALELFEPDAIRVAHRSPMWDDTLAEDVRIARRFAHRYIER